MMGKLKSSFQKLRRVASKDQMAKESSPASGDKGAEQSATVEKTQKESDMSDDSDDDEINPETLGESEDEDELEEYEDEDEDGEEEEEEEDDDDEENDDEDVPLSDAEFDDDADVVPYQKVTINNRAALKKAKEAITLPPKLSFHELMTVDSSAPVELKDIYDDLERELAFYKQGLEAVKAAKSKLKKEGIPFSRPIDYFAEMLKSDEHMDRLKMKLIEEQSAKKAAQEAKKQRELKKFGKSVQHAKLQERQKEKRQTLDKIKDLKRKRANNDMGDDEFDVAIDEATNTESSGKHERGGKNSKRAAKDSKYGHGGKKRFKKSNDAASSADISDFSARKMKRGGSSHSSNKPQKKRPGKNKRSQRR